MSRGPGSLQRRILVALREAHPECRLSRGELRQRFPEADRANLRRAIRSLARMRLVYERTEELERDPATGEWGTRWVFLWPPARVEPLSPEKLDEILRQVQEEEQDEPTSNGGEIEEILRWVLEQRY